MIERLQCKTMSAQYMCVCRTSIVKQFRHSTCHRTVQITLAIYFYFVIASDWETLLAYRITIFMFESLSRYSVYTEMDTFPYYSKRTTVGVGLTLSEECSYFLNHIICT